MDWRKVAQDLLNKASHRNTTKAEADAYQEKAMYIMAKFGIDEAMLRQKEHSTEKPKFRLFKKFRPYSNIKLMLLTSVANILGGRVVESGLDWYVFAYEQDLERIQFLYFSLLAQMHIESAEVKVPQAMSKRAYTDSWLKGFVFGVASRLDTAYRRATGNGQELVLMRDAQIEQAMHDKFNNIKKNSSHIKPSDYGAFGSGAASGLRADIGQDRLGKTAASKPLGN